MGREDHPPVGENRLPRRAGQGSLEANVGVFR